MINGVGDGSSVRRAGVGEALELAAGVAVCVSRGVGDVVTNGVGDGDGVSQNGKHGVGGGVAVGEGEPGVGVGVPSCASAVVGQKAKAAAKTRGMTRRTLHLDNEVRLRRTDAG